jgi:hypothetical protein
MYAVKSLVLGEFNPLHLIELSQVKQHLAIHMITFALVQNNIS